MINDLISNWRRRQALRRVGLAPEVRRFLESEWPTNGQPWRETRYVVLDLETSGLDARRDVILQIGSVEVVDGRVQLASAWETRVRPPDGMTIGVESIRIHQLLPEQLATAPTLTEVLPQLLDRLSGRVLVVHVAAVDVPFLDRALREHYSCGLMLPILDTARLAAALEQLQQLISPQEQRPSPRRLAELARAANIPVLRQHDALADALITAQLFLAQGCALEQFGHNTFGAMRRAGGA